MYIPSHTSSTLIGHYLIVGVVQHVYHVTCLELGEQTLSIMVGNEPSLKNQFPAKKETATRYIGHRSSSPGT